MRQSKNAIIKHCFPSNEPDNKKRPETVRNSPGDAGCFSDNKGNVYMFIISLGWLRWWHSSRTAWLVWLRSWCPKNLGMSAASNPTKPSSQVRHQVWPRRGSCSGDDKCRWFYDGQVSSMTCWWDIRWSTWGWWSIWGSDGLGLRTAANMRSFSRGSLFFSSFIFVFHDIYFLNIACCLLVATQMTTRYKALCPDTWPNWKGTPAEGVLFLVKHLGYKPDEYKMGR